MTLVEQLIPARVRQALTEARPASSVWLVGGALRNHFLGHPHPDLDFAVSGDTREFSRSVADALDAKWYMLDEVRTTARVILPDRHTLDFASLQGNAIQEDLAARDFSINSLAVSLERPDELIDVSDGLVDLKDHKLRAASSEAVSSDPLRAVRAVRLACEFELEIERDTRQQLRTAVEHMGAVSGERIREEMVKALRPDRAACGLRLLDHLGLIEAVIPELRPARAMPQSKDRTQSVWQASLSTVAALGDLLVSITHLTELERPENILVAEAVGALGEFRAELTELFARPIAGGRSHVPIAMLAALFLGLDSVPKLEVSAYRLLSERCRAWGMSRAEIRYSRRILEGARHPTLTMQPDQVSDETIFDYFQAASPIGVVVSLADFLGRPPVAPEHWREQLAVSQTLLEGWFRRRERVVDPPPLVRGDELAEALEIEPGPQIAELLNSIARGQVAGTIKSPEQAIRFARERSGIDLG